MISQDVQHLLAARRDAWMNPTAFSAARQSLLSQEKTRVLAAFEELLGTPDEEVRAQLIEGATILYGAGAMELVTRWLSDPSSTVRWVVCGCLHDCGDERATAPLLDRLKHDADCQVRGAAASALGRIGAAEALPDLHQAYQSDLEVDELGHSPSSQALDAMTAVLRRWTLRQIEGAPPKTFRQSTRAGHLRGTVTAEAIPFDAEGRIDRTPRYAHVPMSAFGFGWGSKLNLQTSLTAPFEVEVAYEDSTCIIERIFVYQQIHDSDEINWAVHTIVDPKAMRTSRDR